MIRAPFFKKKDSPDKPQEQVLPDRLGQETQDGAEAESRNDDAPLESPEPVAAGKAHMDKKSLDLIAAVEQVIQARQQADRSILELQDRLTHANGHIERQTRDIRSLNKVIEERERSISDLEHKLTGKNMKVDQVMEEYRELQSSLSSRIEELGGVIDLERQKYAGLLQKHNDAHAEKTRRINELEEKIGKLEIENAHMKEKHEALRQEKAYLVNMINDFTNRMSSPFQTAKNDYHPGTGDT